MSYIVENLAKDLQLEFPGMQGFSAQNLWYMRQFYIEYSKNQKLQPLVGEISWTKIQPIKACQGLFQVHIDYEELSTLLREML